MEHARARAELDRGDAVDDREAVSTPDALRLAVWPEPIAIARLDAGAALPGWAGDGRFSSVTRTPHELSVVCAEDRVPADVRADRGWRVLAVEGPMDLGLVGVLASLAGPLAQARVSVFAIATHDTDHVLVREADLARACAALEAAGHRIDASPSVSR